MSPAFRRALLSLPVTQSKPQHVHPVEAWPHQTARTRACLYRTALSKPGPSPQPPRLTRSLCRARGQISTVAAGGCEAKGQVWSCTASTVCGHSLQPAHILHLLLLRGFCRVLELVKALRCVQAWQSEQSKKAQRIYPQPSPLPGCISCYHWKLFLVKHWNNFLKKIILPFIHRHFLGFNYASILSFLTITNARNSFKFHLHFFFKHVDNTSIAQGTLCLQNLEVLWLNLVW